MKSLLRGRRGLTLVELAIAMAVVGLLTGMTLIPLRMLEERRQIREEIRRLEVVRDAIVGYALRHRTRARTIEFRVYDTDDPVDRNDPNFFAPEGAARWTVMFRLPGGRPYLPCPDWDGDGYEDRFLTDGQGAQFGMDSIVAVYLFLGDFSFSGGPPWLRASSFPAGPNLLNPPLGSCFSSKGAVPWRTLGVEPSDGWGNRHTYFADPVFASALMGFDSLSVADMYDSRIPLAAGHGPSPRRFVAIYALSDIGGNRITNGVVGWDSRQADDDCPSVICDGRRTGDCAWRRVTSNADDFWGCEWRTVESNLALKAGAVAGDEIFPESFGGKYFPSGGVTDGLPFVLASHGPNGRFAVNHWATLQNPANQFGGASPICNNQAWADIRQNSGNIYFPQRLLAQVDLEYRALIHEAVNGARPSPDTQRCALAAGWDGEDVLEFNRSFFVWEPPGINDSSDFDDLLLWMTREELSLAIPGDIPRLPRMIVPYFP